MATAGVVAALLAASASAQQDCRSIEDDASRLACYDSLALPPKPVEAPPSAKPAVAPPSAKPVEAPAQMKTAEPEKPPPAAVPVEDKVPAMTVPAATETPVTEPAPLDDEVGKEALGRDEDKELVVRGTVVRCVEDATSKYLFYFDNGQIWKQKDNTKIRWQECAFDVTITKDVFGYKMVPDGETRKVRIGRVK
jgi:hypothetical protein